MKKAIMNTMIILFALAMCVGCGQSSEQKEESVPTDVTKAEKQEQVQVEAEDEDTLENGEQVFRVVEVMPKFPGGDAELLKFIAKNVKYPQESQNKGEQGRVICSFVVTNYFANSYKEMVSFFAKDQKISTDDLKDIIDLIEKGKE